MWKKKGSKETGRVTDANAFETESPATRVRVAGAQSCILLGWSNARRFSRRSFIGCHIVSGFICIVKRPRRADIATTQPRMRHEHKRGKNPFPDACTGRARASVLQRV